MLKKTILLALAVMVPLLATANSEFTTTRMAHPSPGGDAIMIPSPVEDYEVTRARLEAEGLWDDDRTPPENPQVGDSWYWWTWHFMGGPLPPTISARFAAWATMSTWWSRIPSGM